MVIRHLHEHIIYIISMMYIIVLLSRTTYMCDRDKYYVLIYYIYILYIYIYIYIYIYL